MGTASWTWSPPMAARTPCQYYWVRVAEFSRAIRTLPRTLGRSQWCWRTSIKTASWISLSRIHKPARLRFSLTEATSLLLGQPRPSSKLFANIMHSHRVRVLGLERFSGGPPVILGGLLHSADLAPC